MSSPDDVPLDGGHRDVYAEASNSDQNILITGSSASEKIFETAIGRCVKYNPWPAILFVGSTTAVCALQHRRLSALLQPLGLKCVLCTDEEQASGWDWDGLLVISTPDVLERITRRKEVCHHAFTKVRLLCVCDLYLVADTRVGISLEALIARFLTAIPSIRIVATSAPLLNLDPVKVWLSATHYVWAPLPNDRCASSRCQIIRVPSKEANHFKFENSLNVKLPDLITKYSKGQSTIIYCSTRKSVELVATFLYRALAPKAPPLHQRPPFTDPKLDELASRGIAYHYAGMPFEDRRAIECLFRQGKLSVLCATNSLASKVKLSCHLVIVKGTKKYSDKGYVDYTANELERLSAGDATTCIILTSKDSVVNRESRSLQVSSRLSGHIGEYLLPDIAVGLIDSRDSALLWAQRTLLSLQVRNIEEVVDDALQRLERLGLISTRNSRVQASPLAYPAGRCGPSLDSLQAILALPRLGPHAAILEQVCMAIPKEECRIFQGDKGLLGRLARNGGLRYPLSGGHILEGWQKAFVVIQIVLGKNDDLGPNLWLARSSRVIMRRAKQLISCMVNSMIQSTDSDPVTLRNAIELAGAIQGECWHEGPGTLRQLDGIGAGYERSLLKASLGTIDALRAADPSTIEFVLKRNPPFGVQLKENMARIPHLSLETHEELHELDDQLKVVIRGRCEGATIERTVYLMTVLRSKTDEFRLCSFVEIHQTTDIANELVISHWSSQRDLTISLLATSHGFSLQLHPQRMLIWTLKREAPLAPKKAQIQTYFSPPQRFPPQAPYKDPFQSQSQPQGLIRKQRQSRKVKDLALTDSASHRVGRYERARYRTQVLACQQSCSEDDHEYVACDGASLMEAFLSYVQAFDNASIQ